MFTCVQTFDVKFTAIWNIKFWNVKFTTIWNVKFLHLNKQGLRRQAIDAAYGMANMQKGDSDHGAESSPGHLLKGTFSHSCHPLIYFPFAVQRNLQGAGACRCSDHFVSRGKQREILFEGPN